MRQVMIEVVVVVVVMVAPTVSQATAERSCRPKQHVDKEKKKEGSTS